MINLKRLKKQLILDEGKSLYPRKNNRGALVVGIGHKVQQHSKVTEEECSKLFIDDLSEALFCCVVVFEEWDALPQDVKEILLNIVFSTGKEEFLTLKDLIAAVYDKNWKKAAEAISSSTWAAQVGSRASRLSSRMEHIEC